MGVQININKNLANLKKVIKVQFININYLNMFPSPEIFECQINHI